MGKRRGDEPRDWPQENPAWGGQAGGREDREQLLWPEELWPGRRRDAAMWRLDRPGRGRTENGPRAGQAACLFPEPPCVAFLGCRWRPVPALASPGQREGVELPGPRAQRLRSGVWRLPSSAMCLLKGCCTSLVHVPPTRARRSASFPAKLVGEAPRQTTGSRELALQAALP